MLQDLECPKAVQHSLFYDWLHYLLLFWLAATVNTAEEKDHNLIHSINKLMDNAVCRAAPDFTRVY